MTRSAAALLAACVLAPHAVPARADDGAASLALAMEAGAQFAQSARAAAAERELAEKVEHVYGELDALRARCLADPLGEVMPRWKLDSPSTWGTESVNYHLQIVARPPAPGRAAGYRTAAVPADPGGYMTQLRALLASGVPRQELQGFAAESSNGLGILIRHLEVVPGDNAAERAFSAKTTAALRIIVDELDALLPLLRAPKP